MRTHEDFAQIKRIDDAATIEFLCAGASALINSSNFTPQDVEKFRISLSTLQFGELGDASLFAQIASQNDEFVKTLCIRYGEVGLWRNLLRYSISRNIKQIKSLISATGEQLLKKSQVNLNRYFTLHISGVPESRVLLASILVDYADILSGICLDLGTLDTTISRFIPNDLAAKTDLDVKVDDHFAKALGFDDIEAVMLPYCAEVAVKNKLVANLDHLYQSSRELIEQYQANQPKVDSSKLQVLCDALSSRVQGLATFQFPRTKDIGSLESRRSDFIAQLSAISSYLNDYFDQLIQFVSKISTIEQTTAHLGQNVVRSVANALMTKGVLATPAEKAANDLVNYCEKHNVNASNLIVAELAKINPHLNIEALDVYKGLTAGENTARSATQEKQSSLKRSERLISFFRSLTAPALVLCTVAPWLLQCGVKTAPESQLVDLRPSVNYHGDGEDDDEEEKKEVAPPSDAAKKAKASSATTKQE